MGNVYKKENGYAYEKNWAGVSGGVTQLQAGLSVSLGVTSHLKPLNKLFNLAPYNEGYQK